MLREVELYVPGMAFAMIRSYVNLTMVGPDTTVLRLCVQMIASAKEFAIKACVTVRLVSQDLIVLKKPARMTAPHEELVTEENVIANLVGEDLTVQLECVPMLAAIAAFVNLESDAYVTLDLLVLIVQRQNVLKTVLGMVCATMGRVVVTPDLQAWIAQKRLVQNFVLVMEFATTTMEPVNASEHGWDLTVQLLVLTKIVDAQLNVQTNASMIVVTHLIHLESNQAERVTSIAPSCALFLVQERKVLS